MKRKPVNRQRWLLDSDIKAVVLEIVAAYRCGGNSQAGVKQVAEAAIWCIADLYRPTNANNVTFYLYEAQASAHNIVEDIRLNVQERPKEDLTLVFRALAEARLRQQEQEREYAFEYAAHLREPRMKVLKKKVCEAVGS